MDSFGPLGCLLPLCCCPAAQWDLAYLQFSGSRDTLGDLSHCPSPLWNSFVCLRLLSQMGEGGIMSTTQERLFF